MGKMDDIVSQVLSRTFQDGDGNSAEVNQLFLENMGKELTLDKFNEELLFHASRGREGEFGRIQLISKYFTWLPIPPQTLAKFQKNPELSSKLRERANEYFRVKDHVEALRTYTLAIMFSPPNTEELGLAYANRSASLLATGKSAEALLDIELALGNKYPEKLKVKLFQRRIRCEEEGKIQGEDKDQIKSCEEEKLKRERFCERILFRVKKPNPLMASAEEFVETRYDPSRGRELVVNREIPAGTVLLVEQPYVTVLKDVLKWDTCHCHYCLRKISRGVPCNDCTFAIYCDDSCLASAFEEFHRHECPCMPYLRCNETPRYILLALRIVCKLGPELLFSLYQQIDRSCGLLREEQLQSLAPEYTPIYNLVSHPNQMDALTLYTNAVNAMLVTKILLVNSNFFHCVDSQHSQDFFQFVATLLLHHIENIPCNSISLDELEGLEGTTLLQTMNAGNEEELALKIRALQFPQFAAGVFSVASLMNHSCDPNVTRINRCSSQGTLAVVASRALKKNEEIVTCYSRSFVNDSLDIRNAHLYKNYFFECNCIACRQQWPGLQALMKMKPIFSCKNCNGKFCHEEKDSDKFRKCILRGNKNSCASCGTSWDENDLDIEFEQYLQTFFLAYKLVLKNSSLEAIRLIVPVLNYFHSHLAPPFIKTHMSQDIYKQALELILYFS